MVLRMRLRAAKVKTAQREVTMSYQALYRKWRPDNFNDVKGQDTIVTTLRNQINADRIGHAYLFCGTRGTGKTSVAHLLQSIINEKKNLSFNDYPLECRKQLYDALEKYWPGQLKNTEIKNQIEETKV